MKVVIIGGGPAGMLSAISAGTNKNDVTISCSVKISLTLAPTSILTFNFFKRFNKACKTS